MMLTPCFTSTLKLLFLGLLLWAIPLSAQTDTITIENGKLKFDQLPLGTATYLHYRQDTTPNAVMYDLSVWERSCQLEGNDMHFTWNWYRPDSGAQLIKNVIVARETFQPKSMAMTEQSNGQTKYKLFFHFKPDAMYSDTDTLKHQYAPINIPYSLFAFCWDLDLETFSMLPMKVGKVYTIPFYQPAGAPPAYYQYHIQRKEKISFAGNLVNCWVVRHYHKDKSEYSEWWLDTKSYRVIKMKSRYGKTFRYKYLIAG